VSIHGPIKKKDFAAHCEDQVDEAVTQMPVPRILDRGADSDSLSRVKSLGEFAEESAGRKIFFSDQ
jgi:hypothetical protein